MSSYCASLNLTHMIYDMAMIWQVERFSSTKKVVAEFPRERSEVRTGSCIVGTLLKYQFVARMRFVIL